MKHRSNAFIVRADCVRWRKAFTGLAPLLVSRKHSEFLGPSSVFLFGMCCNAKFLLPISKSPLLFFPYQIEEIRSG